MADLTPPAIYERMDQFAALMDEHWPGWREALEIVDRQCEFCLRPIDSQTEDYRRGITGHWAHERCRREELK